MDTRFLPRVILLVCVLTLSSCGGGSSGTPTPPQPPPPAGDFALAIQAATVTTQQGGALQFQTVQVNSLNGFKGTISLMLSGLPTGVTSTPAGPFSIPVPGPFQATTFQLAASQTTP